MIIIRHSYIAIIIKYRGQCSHNSQLVILVLNCVDSCTYSLLIINIINKNNSDK